MRLLIESFVRVDHPSLPSFVFFFKVAVSQKALVKSLGSPIQKIRLGMVRLFLMIFGYIETTIQLVKLKSLLLELQYCSSFGYFWIFFWEGSSFPSKLQRRITVVSRRFLQGVLRVDCLVHLTSRLAVMNKGKNTYRRFRLY